MEETYQITSALKYLSFGKHVALVTDARFSGVSTGACVGHVGPEALAGGPIGRVRDGDTVEIIIDRNTLDGRVDLVATIDGADPIEALRTRPMAEGLDRDENIPDDTRLWAALQQVGGGSWGGCTYDVDKIIETLNAGQAALAAQNSETSQQQASAQ